MIFDRHILILTAFLLGAVCVTAQEKKQAETAWENYAGESYKSRYVFGAVRVAPDIIRMLSGEPDDHGESPDDEPALRKRPGINDLAPPIETKRLPKCLPKAYRYNDISKLLLKNGAPVGKDEWILFSSGLGGGSHVYYCLSQINADILEMLMGDFGCCGSYTFHQLVTLVSVENPGITNNAWTAERLEKHNPRVHARFGMTCRSGERTWTEFASKQPKSESFFIFEPTLNAEHKQAACRIELTCKIGENEPLVINQRTAFSANLNKPFIMDCGVRGKLRRNYLLKIETQELPGIFHQHEQQPHRTPIEKIEGIYAFSKPDAKGNPQQAYRTNSYRCQNSFLERFRMALHVSPAEDGDPFDDENLIDPATIPAPVRITPQESHPYFQTQDKVFNLTPQFKILGLSMYRGEWIHYNTTRDHLIVHGTVSIHSRA